jgi:hypothetical protein
LRTRSLVALAAVFLACVGAAHLFRASPRCAASATSRSCSRSARRRRAEQLFLTQLALQGLAAGLLASALGALLLPLAARRAELPAGRLHARRSAGARSPS